MRPEFLICSAGLSVKSCQPSHRSQGNSMRPQLPSRGLFFIFLWDNVPIYSGDLSSYVPEFGSGWLQFGREAGLQAYSGLGNCLDIRVGG